MVVAGAVPGCGCWKGTSLSAQGGSGLWWWSLWHALFYFRSVCLLCALWNGLHNAEMALALLRHVLQFCGIFLNRKDFNFSALLNNLWFLYLQSWGWPEDVIWVLQKEIGVRNSVSLFYYRYVFITEISAAIEKWRKKLPPPITYTHP